MQDKTMFLAVAGFVLVVAFAFAASSYVRALNAIFGFLREKGYTDWGVRRTPGYVDSRFLSDRLANRATMGIGVRGINDQTYRQLLSAVRNSLLACIALFAIFVIGLGWFTKSP